MDLSKVESYWRRVGGTCVLEPLWYRGDLNGSTWIRGESGHDTGGRVSGRNDK